MSYSILLTSLYARNETEPVRYYYIKDGEKHYYCDAMLSCEASSKYILSKYHIDEIITIGSKSTYDEGDEIREIVLREGRSFYTADIRTLSSYSLLRYRLSQYIEELDIERQDMEELLNEDMRTEVTRFLKHFFREKVNTDGTRKFNRFFDELSRNDAMQNALKDAVLSHFPNAADNIYAFHSWIRYYLYDSMKDSSKLEILDGNENAVIRFVPTRISRKGAFPIENMLELIGQITRNGKEDVSLYIGVHSDDTTDSFVLMNIIDILKCMPDSRVTVKNIVTTESGTGLFTCGISDETESYAITELLAGTRAFLDYGKVDRIMNYWSSLRADNPFIDSMLYAMRDIDIGISLCDISQMEAGMERLRGLFDTSGTMLGNDYYSRLFSLLIEGIRKDYGKLLEGDSISFIELVKWGFRKKFYQQTLTIVESRAPAEFIDKGIFYYMDSEDEREKVLRLLSDCFNDLEPYQRYQMNDISHYFVKFYGRRNIYVRGSQRQIQKGYADYRFSTIGNEDPEIMTGHTLSNDPEAVRDLLFAYYYLSSVRNITNHASMEAADDERLVSDESDISVRLETINQVIEYFIRCFDRVLATLPEEKEPTLKVTDEDVRINASHLRWEQRKKKSNNKNRRKRR